MIRIAIFGYGNLGRGVECAVRQNEDMSLVGIFTRRDAASVKPLFADSRVYNANDIEKMQNDIDVVIICGGSATDLPVQSPKLAGKFNIVDSFDTHARIPEHFANVDSAAKEGKRTAVISAGWDPGLFSLNRVISEAVLPCGNDYTFWGKGVSQGHSDAIRRIDGVIDARQYTIPVANAMDRVRNGENPTLSAREKHTRLCFVVADENADKARIESEIKNMPNYFADYDTTVHFISMEEMKREHSSLPHGGVVIRSGSTGVDNNNHHVIEFSLKLDSNPEFTSSVLVACARAAYRMAEKGEYGAKTILDIPPYMLSKKTNEELRRTML